MKRREKMRCVPAPLALTQLPCPSRRTGFHMVVRYKDCVRTASLLAAIAAMLLLTACSSEGGSAQGESQAASANAVMETEETGRAGEMLSEKAGNEEKESESKSFSKYIEETGVKSDQPSEQVESETEAESEPLSEYIALEETELVYRGLIDSLDEERAAWAQNFDVREVDDLVYITKNEGETSYEVTDPDLIQQFFDAIMHIEIASRVGKVTDTPGNIGDMVVFNMRDGKEVAFKFCMGSILIGDYMYETDHADMLWELTGNLIEPQTEETVENSEPVK